MGVEQKLQLLMPRNKEVLIVDLVLTLHYMGP